MSTKILYPIFDFFLSGTFAFKSSDLSNVSDWDIVSGIIFYEHAADGNKVDDCGNKKKREDNCIKLLIENMPKPNVSMISCINDIYYSSNRNYW